MGFGTITATHKEVGKILGVNANSVRNMRDEFDPLHDNPRAGWYQRPCPPSRAKVVEAFQDLPEEELRDVVLEILTNPKFAKSDDFSDIVNQISKREKKQQGKRVFIVRGPTGRKAEEAFIAYHRGTKSPLHGRLTDMRDYGCGYDFEITDGVEKIQVEVKGLDGASGGVVFTSKEWGVAKKNGKSYFLAVIRNVSGTPTVQLIRNPAALLNPKKSVFSTVQVRWNVKESDLLQE